MNTAARDLEVPDEAVDELYTQRNTADRAAAVRAISRPVVIAELQRLLESGNVAAAALVRLDELEAGQ